MRLFYLVLPLMFLMSCSGTWQGIKEDTKAIGRSIGEATESAGESIQDASK